MPHQARLGLLHRDSENALNLLHRRRHAILHEVHERLDRRETHIAGTGAVGAGRLKVVKEGDYNRRIELFEFHTRWLALGSDGGPEEMNPFLNIMLASTYAAAPGEALSREQALLAYTAGGAHAGRAERTTGRLVLGLAANLAVLSQDILRVSARDLPATRSLLTLVDGVVVYEAPELTARPPAVPAVPDERLKGGQF